MVWFYLAQDETISNLSKLRTQTTEAKPSSITPTSPEHLINETARRFANKRSAATAGQLPLWSAFTDEEKTAMKSDVRAMFLAQDQAVQNLKERDEDV